MRLHIDYVFDTAQGRVEGLQDKVLNEMACALFVYESRLPRRFHMMNVPTDLWLSAVSAGKCVESVLMKAETPGPYQIESRAMLIVESRKEIPVGSRLSIKGDVLVVE